MTYATPTMYERTCLVERVVDGDTLYLVVDLGVDTTVRMTVRLYGINTPELPTVEGKAAAQAVISWVATSDDILAAKERRYKLRTVKDRKEKFGRYLADLVPLAGGESLCAYLLRTGHAVEYLP